jgi:AmpD protein
LALPRLRVDAATDFLADVRRVDSPNFDARPPGADLDLIVVHGISLPPGAFGGPWIEQLFTNELPPDEHPYFATVSDLRVSSHVLVRRDGREACNDFSIGIELEGADTIPYEDAQYRVLANLVAALCAAYPTLSPERLVGHSDVAPGRKTDPGPAFDWRRARRLVAMACARTTPTGAESG